MTKVKVTLRGKNGNEYDALVPITTACEVLCVGKNNTNICRIGYSVVHKCHDFLLSNVINYAGRAQLNKDIAPIFALMERSKNILFTNGVWLYRD